MTHRYIKSLLGTPSHGAKPVRKQPPKFSVPDDIKFEHTWILGGSGAGKTTLFYKEILENLEKSNPPAMVIIDPKGTMLQTISRLKCFDPVNGKHKDRLVIIDMTDFDHLPALNMFHPADPKRFASYSPQQRQQVINNTINLLAYAFDSRKNALTAQQTTCFNHACRLLFTLDRTATLADLISLLGDKATNAEDSKWYADINRLPPTPRTFFLTKFFKDWKTTRQGVETRLHGILEDPLVDAIFSAPIRKVDMFAYLQQRKTVIINVPAGLMLEDTALLLSRYAVALTLSAALERLTIPKSQWTPAFLFVDEFQQVADEQKSPQLLRMAREYRLGAFLANQDIDAIPSALRSPMSAATTTKYASALGGMDLTFMAREMRCRPETLAAIGPDKVNNTGYFACYVRGHTPQPVTVSIPFGAVEHEPKMSDASYEILLQRSRSLISIPPEPPQPEQPKPKAKPQEFPDHDAGEPGDTY